MTTYRWFPSDGSRLVLSVSGRALRAPAVGTEVPLFLDEELTEPATGLLHADDTPVDDDNPLRVDAFSMLPEFQVPTTLPDILWTSISGGPAWPVNARVDDRLDDLDDRVTDATTAADSAVSGLAGKQPLDSDLTAIAALTPTDGDVIQRVSGSWLNRTMAQLKSALSLTKSDVGLGNVDNTADASKPVSTSQQTALNGKVSLSLADAKGDLFVATANDTLGRLAVGADGTVPRASSGASTGIAWGAVIEVREYTTSAGPVTTPSGILGVLVTLIQAGPAGGSGRRGAAGTARGGGGGGGAGGVIADLWVPAAAWGASYTVTVGAAGVGGAARTADNTDGAAGTAGGGTSLTTGTLTLSADFAGAGGGGTTSGGSGGSGGFPLNTSGGSGGTAAGSSGGAAHPASAVGAAAAGGGGGISSGDAASAGGSGGSAYGTAASAGGVVGGASPAAGTLRPGAGGTGGGGGAASTSGAAQSGADGVGYGSPGGGGGASANGNASGAGGAGGPGYARVIFVYG